MIALDTNVLVRLVTRDDEAQAQRAKAAFDRHAGEPVELFITDIVLAELCWTLARAYQAARTDIARTVRALLDNSSLVFESRDVVRAALAAFEAGTLDFPDCLIVAKARHAGCSCVLTFDRRMTALPNVELL